jgi:hypothetical protein
MNCMNCGSDNRQIFNGELAIHFPGFDGLDKPIVWVFPKLSVCLNCGFTEFSVPARELSVLRHGKPVEGAVPGSRALFITHVGHPSRSQFVRQANRSRA